MHFGLLSPETNYSWVWPARNRASDNTDGTLPPMGQRIRLKSTFDTSGYPPQTKAVLEVLKTHGAMVADNGAPFRIYFEPDSRWTFSDLINLETVATTNFEAVDVSSLMINPDSGNSDNPCRYIYSVDNSHVTEWGGILGQGIQSPHQMDILRECRILC